MGKLKKVCFATELLGNDTDSQTYGQIYSGHIPDGVVVRIGQTIRFNEEKLREWIASGGSPLKGENEKAQNQNQSLATAV